MVKEKNEKFNILARTDAILNQLRISVAVLSKPANEQTEIYNQGVYPALAMTEAFDDFYQTIIFEEFQITSKQKLALIALNDFLENLPSDEMDKIYDTPSLFTYKEWEDIRLIATEVLKAFDWSSDIEGVNVLTILKIDDMKAQ